MFLSINTTRKSDLMRLNMKMFQQIVDFFSLKKTIKIIVSYYHKEAASSKEDSQYFYFHISFSSQIRMF